METLYPPSSDKNAKKELVPYVRRDVGTAWARALPEERVADLIDLAGLLAQVFPLTKERRITRKRFDTKLKNLEQLQALDARLAQITGWSSHGVVTLYDVWWAWAWVHHYAKTQDNDPDQEGTVKERTARKMGLDEKQANERLARRDISYMVNIFLGRACRELEGEVKLRTTMEAISGSAKAIESYFRYVAPKEEKRGTEFQIDPTKLSEQELQAEIEKMKRTCGEGEPDTIDVEPTDVEFTRDGQD